MPLVEKLGSFYLGKEYDLALGQLTGSPVNYDSRDLTTHAVCVGMTGSGKTGLCIDLLEEAAIDGVPAIIVDPKGDITNLLLAFPDLSAEDFRSWINLEDAERRGLSPEAYAAQVAETWRKGLAAWDQGPERVRLLKDSADFAIYTPGSEAGLPVSILSSLRAPALDWDVEAETLRERIQGTVTALLGLVGVEADPLRSREYILLANILEHAWRAGQDLDLAALILAVQQPPFHKLGVFDLEAFFPEKDRFTLAMLLNNLIASPGFAAWTAGEPLELAALLRDSNGKPRHSIFYIAHLDDAERMFFVTILLEQLIGWMRSQPGTTSLRALFYMDEIFGFFPPVREPPSKRPLLTLLKQARAFGLGLVLTTQNPADVDYKGLANAGTWFVGKLQTERDKLRLMEGLTGALTEAGSTTDPKTLDGLISSLHERTFLLHDVHAGAPVVFQTRWAMSYLRGPLTRQQIKQLMAPRKAAASAASPAQRAFQAGSPLSEPGETPVVSKAGESNGVSASADVLGASAGPAAQAAQKRGATPNGVPPPGVSGQEELAAQPPSLPAAVKQIYLPLTMTGSQALAAVEEHVGAAVTLVEQRLVYEPGLLGLASLQFVDRKLGLEQSRDCAHLLLLADEGPVLAWKDAWAIALDPRDLAPAPQSGALFRPDLPAGLSGVRSLSALSNSFADYLYRTQAYFHLHNPSLRLHAQPGETERDFRARCQQAAREARDAAVDQLAERYDARFRRLQDRLEQAQEDLASAQAEHAGTQRAEMLSGIAGVAGALGLFGRRGTRSLAGAAGRQPLAQAGRADTVEGQAEIARLRADLAAAQSTMQAEAGALTRTWVDAANDVQALRIAPRKADVEVRLVALAWAGSWRTTYQIPGGQTRSELVPAYPLTES